MYAMSSIAIIVLNFRQLGKEENNFFKFVNDYPKLKIILNKINNFMSYCIKKIIVDLQSGGKKNCVTRFN